MKVKMSHIREVSVDPNMARCPVGSKFSQSRYVFADICIYHEGIPNSKAYFNSDVLKAALLSNPELIKTMGLKVIDLNAELIKGIDEEEYIPEDITEVINKEIPPAEEEIIDYKNMDYQTLVSYAKTKGMIFTKNPKKVDILEFLK